MDLAVEVVKPLLLSLASHSAVKNLVLDLLKKYVDSTDNSMDNLMYEMVKDKLLTPQK